MTTICDPNPHHFDIPVILEIAALLPPWMVVRRCAGAQQRLTACPVGNAFLHFAGTSDDWRSVHYFLGESIFFESIDLTLSVEEIYHRVENNDMRQFIADKANNQ